MLRRLAAQLDKRNWQARIKLARTGLPSQSCSNIAFYEDDDCLIRYRKMGQGPSVVFMCDGPATLEVYDELIGALSSRYTVIVFEVPGNGFSVPKPSYRFSFKEANDAVSRFLRTVAGEAAILAFSCGGAYAALDIAARYPGLCSGLVIIQAPSWSEEMKWKQTRNTKGLVTIPFVGQLIFPKMMQPRAPAWYDLVMANTPHVEHFCHCTATAFEQGATFAMPSMFQNYLVGENPPFEKPEQPAIALWGEQDGSHLDTDKSSSCMLAKSVKPIFLQHVGHFPELEDPKGFRSLLDEFASHLGFRKRQHG